jgi:hypothetical protein
MGCLAGWRRCIRLHGAGLDRSPASCSGRGRDPGAPFPRGDIVCK